MSDAQSHTEIKLGSERNFGLTFTVFCLIVAFWPLMHGGSVRLIPLGLAGLFLVPALFYPAILAPLNRLWFKLGLAVAKITGPIVMGLVFAIAFVPAGFLKRRFGTDAMRLKRDEPAPSYWLARDPDSPPGSMKRQF